MFTPDDVLYCAMPLYHGNALNANLFPALRSGATIALRRKFSASAFLPDAQRYGVTFFNTVGRALNHILSTPETDGRSQPLDQVRARARDRTRRRARVPQALRPAGDRGLRLERERDHLDSRSDVAEGLARPAARRHRRRDPRSGDRRGEAARALRRARQAAERGRSDRRARRAATRPSRFEGYYNNPEADAERTRNGWYWSGDLGYRDEAGVFWFAGRNADWIRVDGENFAAAPIERILARFPGADGVAVYAVPDSRTGDQVMAAIEMLRRRARSIPTRSRRFLAEQRDLGTKWAPRYVRIVDALPVGATDKIDKRPLRAERWETTDPLFWRAPRTDTYEPFTAADADALRAEFEANQRANLLR